MTSTADNLSWLWVASGISFLAAIGGIVVLRGLWLEGYRHPESFIDIEEQRTHHKREGAGIKWVFWGVAFEVLIAFGLTFKEGWEAHSTAIEIARNNPLNQPVVDINANAVFNLNASTMQSVRNPDPKLAQGVHFVRLISVCVTVCAPAQILHCNVRTALLEVVW